jgi:hypothetical protein
MFKNILVEIRKNNQVKLDRFAYYLDRHIAVGTDVHGPMARARHTRNSKPGWRVARDG